MWKLNDVVPKLGESPAPKRGEGESTSESVGWKKITMNDLLLMTHLMEENDFYLVRLDLSLLPDRPGPPDFVTTWASYSISLHSEFDGKGPLVYDILPKSHTRAVKEGIEAELKPSLEFSGMKASVGGLKRTISWETLVPVIVGTGSGTDRAAWEFRWFKREAVVGPKRMFMVVKASKSVRSCTASLVVV